MFCFSCNKIVSLECIEIDLRVLGPLKMICTLVCQDSSKFLSEAKYIGNRDKDIFLDF